MLLVAMKQWQVQLREMRNELKEQDERQKT